MSDVKVTMLFEIDGRKLPAVIRNFTADVVAGFDVWRALGDADATNQAIPGSGGGAHTDLVGFLLLPDQDVTTQINGQGATGEVAMQADSIVCVLGAAALSGVFIHVPGDVDPKIPLLVLRNVS